MQSTPDASTSDHGLALDALQPGVVIAATLDTKGEHVAYLRAELEARGVRTLVIDCSIKSTGEVRSDIGPEAVAHYAGTDIATIRSWPERAPALERMLAGLERCVIELERRQLLQGFIGIGGGTNASLAGRAFKVLPYGVPKLLVSTAASGDTKPFVEGSDVILIHPVVDFIGLNGPLKASLQRAAATMASILDIPFWPPEGRPVIGLTAVGATTAAAEYADTFFKASGFATYVFHARGPGGVALEELVSQGRIAASFDLATTEITDEVLGGMRSAGPGRLDAAIAAGIPQVIVPGAIDLLNFSGPQTVPEHFRHRKLITHTPSSTLVRVSADESRQIGEWIGRKLIAARAPVSVFVPMLGFSSYDRPGSELHDPAACAAFLAGIRAALKDRPDIPVEALDLHINDERFVRAACERMREYLQN